MLEVITTAVFSFVVCSGYRVISKVARTFVADATHMCLADLPHSFMYCYTVTQSNTCFVFKEANNMH